MCLSDESKESEIVYNKICGMTKLIDTVSALAYSIIRIYKEKKLLKQLGHNHYCCIMSVLLVHMNVFVTFEENIIISSKTFKKQNVTDRQMEKQFSVPISHVYHLPLMRIYFQVQEYM